MQRGAGLPVGVVPAAARVGMYTIGLPAADHVEGSRGRAVLFPARPGGPAAPQSPRQWPAGSPPGQDPPGEVMDGQIRVAGARWL